ncbi:unnamed protein product [Protopolystoma xenopodis]|uniref:Peptidase M14 domain-containing protein n=1 Tax=Protopolystoma xenopodis TaxID=117903 RepID=A0A3S4ZUG1_9PLAT|nr:unnamed protein product [Protopolystoma xenopodis]
MIHRCHKTVIRGLLRTIQQSSIRSNPTSVFGETIYEFLSIIGSFDMLLTSIGHEAPGGSDDYVSGELNVDYSYTIELADQGRHGFVLPAAYIRPVGKQLWTALQVFVDSI